jgi:hypothetical protein
MADEDEALSKFHTVLQGFDIEMTKEIINKLDSSASIHDTYLLGLFMNGDLAPKIKTEADGALVVGGDIIDVINLISIGKGAFGETFRSKTQLKAYKYVKITGNELNNGNIIKDTFDNERLNHEIRKILVEAWIQTILGTDKTKGTNICQIEGLFIQEGFTGGTLENKFLTIVIQMKILGATVPDYLNVPDEVKFEYIKPLLINLTETLIHFNEAYGFSHRDLHMGNVMFNSRKAALLDFGMSCITYRSVTYGDPIRFSGRCWTFDMYTFLASLLTGSGRPRIPGGKMSDDCYGTIRNMFTFGDKNLYNEAVTLVETNEIRLPAHVFYPDRFKKYNIAPTLALVTMTHLLDIQRKIRAPSYPDDQQILDARIERTRLETRNWSLIAAADARAADLAADVLKFDRSELYVKNAKKTAENARESRERKADAKARYDAAVATAAQFYKTAAAASLRRRGPPVASSASERTKVKSDPSCCSWSNGIWSCFCSRRKRGGSRKTKYSKGCGPRATRRRR